MQRDDRLRKCKMPASVIADRCDLMQLRSAGQEDPLVHLAASDRVSNEIPHRREAEPAREELRPPADE